MKREFSETHLKVSSEIFVLDDIAEVDEADVETRSARPNSFWVSGNMIPVADRLSFVACTNAPSNVDEE
eukprot:768553-Hanusia_phi.AAC.2